MYKEILDIAKSVSIMGPTQFSLRACVMMVAAVSIYKCYLISLNGVPTRQMIRYSSKPHHQLKLMTQY